MSGKRQHEQLTHGSLSRYTLYTIWVGESWLLFALWPVVALALLGKLEGLFTPIVQTDLLPRLAAQSIANDDIAGVIVGVVMGIVALFFVMRWKTKQAKTKRQNPDPIIPRSREELWLATVVSVTAGVTEEIFFRAALPIILYVATSNELVAIWSSIVLFGVEHMYQGWKGVLATMFIGFVFMRLFISSGTLLVPVVLHILIDFNSFVLQPWLAMRKGITRERIA